MKDEDLLSIVQELPLYVQLTLYRSIRVSPTASIVSPHEGFLSIFSHQSSRNLSPETTPANVSNPREQNIKYYIGFKRAFYLVDTHGIQSVHGVPLQPRG